MGEKTLLTAVVESSRLLLTATLPSTSINRQPIPSANISLQNPSLLSSTSTAVTSTLSFTSQISFIPPSFGKASRQQRKRKKKALTLNDDVPEEAKSLQYKALGAYFISQLGIIIVCT